MLDNLRALAADGINIIIRVPMIPGITDTDDNIDGLIDAIDRSNGAPDLVILPEMFTTGFTMDTATFAETMDGDTATWMSLLARDYDVSLCGSRIVEENRGLLPLWRSAHLPVDRVSLQGKNCPAKA